MKKKAKRAAIYARVSTQDRQDPETQLRDLRQYAERRGFEVVGEYVDRASGRTEDRQQYQQLLTAARHRKVDVVLVWRYDRFARSMGALVRSLDELRALGVDFISMREETDTTTPSGRMFFGVMASLAEFESRLIGERVRAGMRRARAQGKHLGRPPVPRRKVDQVLELRGEGHTYRAIAKRTGLGYSTVARIATSASG